MTSRLTRLSILIAVAVTMIVPTQTYAQTENSATPVVENKQRLVFEIKNFPKILIPDTEEKNDDAPMATVEIIPIEVEQKVEIAKANPYELPPKVTGDERVYMHEPEIRAYICPKMGQKNCDIFVAVLKAENGTHECTRDNRGLNRNGSVDVGLAQINWNPKWNPPYTVEQLRDCKFNLDIALQKYQARGFQPWYAYTKGAYKKFLKPSTVSAAAVQ